MRGSGAGLSLGHGLRLQPLMLRGMGRVTMCIKGYPLVRHCAFVCACTLLIQRVPTGLCITCIYMKWQNLFATNTTRYAATCRYPLLDLCFQALPAAAAGVRRLPGGGSAAGGGRPGRPAVRAVHAAAQPAAGAGATAGAAGAAATANAGEAAAAAAAAARETSSARRASTCGPGRAPRRSRRRIRARWDQRWQLLCTPAGAGGSSASRLGLCTAAGAAAAGQALQAAAGAVPARLPPDGPAVPGVRLKAVLCRAVLRLSLCVLF